MFHQKKDLMKKYIMLALSIGAPLYCMQEQQAITPMPCHEHHQLRTTVFLNFLQKNNIAIENRTILNVECSVGALSAKLAKKAAYVYGFDSHKNVPNDAYHQYSHLDNLYLQPCRSLNFTSPELCQLAVIDSFIDQIKNKKALLLRINNNLAMGGEFFTTILTQNNPQSPALMTAIEMIPDIQKHLPDLTTEEITNMIAFSCPSLEEVSALLDETGFEIIKSEEQCVYQIMPKNKLIALYSTMLTKHPLSQYITNEPSRTDLNKQYIENFIAKLNTTNNDEYIEPIIATIIHARKVQ